MRRLLYTVLAAATLGLPALAAEPATGLPWQIADGNLVFGGFDGGGMSGRFLYFEQWDADNNGSADRDWPIDTVLEHDGEIWWAETDPALADEPGTATAWVQISGSGSGGGGSGGSTVAFHEGLSADTAVTSSQTSWTQILQMSGAAIDINEGAFTVESQTDGTERVCVPEDGLYVVRAQIAAEADASTTQRFTLESRFTITPDGGTEAVQTEIARQYNRGRDTDAASGATNLSAGHLAVLYDLDADDCIGVQTRTQLSAVNYTIQSSISYLEITKQQLGAQGPEGPAGAAGADGADGADGGASLSDDTPEAVATVGAAGSSTDAPRADHRHAGVATLSASDGLQVDQTVGAVSITARLSSAAPEPVGATESAGGAEETISRSTHVHAGVTSIIAGTNITVDVAQGDVTIAASGGGGSDLAIQEEGTEVTAAATSINFTGAGATATASNGAVTVNIPASGGATPNEDIDDRVAALLQGGDRITVSYDDANDELDLIGDREVQRASAATFNTSTHVITATVSQHPVQEAVFSFVVPSNIGTDTDAVELHTSDGTDTSTDRALVDRDDNAIRAVDLTAGRRMLVQLVSSEWVAMTPADVVDEDRLVPAGGSTSQALLKSSGTDYALEWGDVLALSGTAPADVAATAAAGSATDAPRRDHVHRVPIDNTMQFDGSGDLGVNTQRVVQEVSEWVQHFATGDSHDTSGHSGKYQEYTSSNTHRRIGSVQYDFDPENDGGTRTFQVFILELTGRNIDVILGSSQVYSGDAQQHRFHFTDGVMINPNVRIGIGLHRTDGGNNEGLRVRAGAESQDSPRESYDDASADFSFVGRFNHDRPTPTVNETVGGTAANQIYGNPEIFYQIIHTHASLVGDGNVSAAHISSGSAAADDVLKADGSGGAAFGAVVVHGNNIVDNTIPTAKYGNETVTPGKMSSGSATDGHVATADGSGGVDYEAIETVGGVTHLEAGATYNNNVITVQVTAGTVRAGDGILFAVPTPFGSSATQEISLEIDGQADSTHPLHDRNGDALHEDDLVGGSLYVAISDADSWDILVLPDAVGSGTVTLNSGTPQPVAAAGSAGSSEEVSRASHAHEGVHSIATSGNGLSHNAADGDVTITHTPDEFDLHDDVATSISTLDSNDRFVVSDENLSGDPNRYVTLEDLATKLAGTNLTASAGVLSASGGGSDLAVQEEGTEVASATTTINFTGAGATATASNGTVTVDIPGGSGGGSVANPNATRIVTAAAWDSGAGGNESVTATGWRDCDLLLPIFHDSSESAAAQENSARPVHGVDLFFSATLDQDGSIYVGVSQNEGVRVLELSDTSDVLSFQWVGTSPAPGSSDTMDIWCLNAGGINHPGNEMSDSSISVGANLFDETTIDVPSGTWGFVNFGDIGTHRSGEWFRFLVADLTGLTDGIDNGATSDGNALMFYANEERYFFLGKTSGGKVLVGASNVDVNPSEVRIRTN